VGGYRDTQKRSRKRRVGRRRRKEGMRRGARWLREGARQSGARHSRHKQAAAMRSLQQFEL